MKIVFVNKSSRWLLFFTINLLSFALQAQEGWLHSVDSVFQSKTIPDTGKIKQLSVLVSYLNYEGDAMNSQKYAREMVSLARRQSDHQYGIYAYSTLMVVEKDVNNIITAMDSCIWYINHSSDPLARSIGYDRIGKLKAGDEAIAYYFKALKEVEGKKLWDQEREVYHDIIGYYTTQKNYVEAVRYGGKNIENARNSGGSEYLCMTLIEQSTNYWEGYNGKMADQMLQLCNEAYSIYQANNSNFTYAYYIYTMLMLNFTHAYTANHELDVALQCANKAYEASITMGSSDYIIPATLCISDILQQKNEYAAAAKYVERAYSLFYREDGNDPFTSELTLELASIYTHMKKYKEAAEYLKEGINQLKNRFTQNNQRINDHMKVSYQIEKKENERVLLEGQLSISRKQNIFYAILSGFLLLAGIAAFLSFRNKFIASKQAEQIKNNEVNVLKIEKEKAEILEQLYKEQVKTQQEESELKRRETEDLQKRLMMKGILADHKSKTLGELKDILLSDPELKKYKRTIEGILNQEINTGAETENLMVSMETIHPDFYKWLQQKADNKLTELDLKYCSCIYMKMSSKEMADLFKVDPKTIRVTKYRLKQKLGLSKEEDLNQFIEALL